jgi:putative cell wall-binding protein
VTALTGLSVLGLASSASAAIGSGSSVVASSAPSVVKGVANQTAGSWTITLAAGTTWATGNTITLTVTDSAAAATLTFDKTPTVTVTSPTGDVNLCATSGCTTTGGAGVNTFTITLTGLGQTSTPADETIAVGSVAYDVAVGAAGGPDIVTAAAAGTLNASGAFIVTSAANADVVTAAIATLFADTTPTIGPGATTAVGSWELYMSGPGNAWTTGDKIYITVARNDALNCETLSKPDSIGFSGTATISAKVITNGATATPTLTAALAQGGSCGTFSGVDNELVLTFTNGGTITGSGLGAAAPIDITVSGLSYVVSGDVGDTISTTANLGPVDIAEGYNVAPTFTTTNTPPTLDTLAGGVALGAAGTSLTAVASIGDTTLTVAALPGAIPTGASLLLGSAAGTNEVVTTTASAAKGATSIHVLAISHGYAIGQPVGGPSNAQIGTSTLTVTSNKPSTTLQYNFSSSGSEVVDQAVNGPITITEGSPGALSSGTTGWACIALSPGAAVGRAAEWSALPTVSATGGGIAVGNAAILTPGSQTGPTELTFQVTTPSSGTAGTVTVSGISLNVPGLPGLTLEAALWYGANNSSDACNGANTGVATKGALTYSGSPYAKNPFTVANVAGRTYGVDADTTAAVEFASDVNGGAGCETNQGMEQTLSTTGLATTNAVVVTDQAFQDALSGSYLAGRLFNSSVGVDGNYGTGVLVTPTNSLAPALLEALRLAGVTDVYVVGGPLAVSQADVTQLQSTPIYTCAGTTLKGLTGAVNLTVHWIYGQTADATAAAVATYFGPTGVGTAKFLGAYSGMYNDTTGSSGSAISSAPDTPVSTAVLCTDTNFPDAASGSAVAAYRHFPLLLTGPSSLAPEAAAALIDDAIQQVIVLGGPDVISDSTLATVESMGISVLRIAGEDYTDTSQLLAQFELGSVNSSGQVVGLDWEVSYVMVARGDFYTDAITAGPLSSVEGPMPVLLTWDTNATGNPAGTDYLSKFLTSVGQTAEDPGTPADGTANNLWFIGGPLAITPGLETAIATDLNG